MKFCFSKDTLGGQKSDSGYNSSGVCRVYVCACVCVCGCARMCVRACVGGECVCVSMSIK